MGVEYNPGTLTRWQCFQINVLLTYRGAASDSSLANVIMPKCPNGKRRPTGSFSATSIVAQIIVGGNQCKRKPGLVRSGRAGTSTCSENPASEQPSGITKKAAGKRWV